MPTLLHYFIEVLKNHYVLHLNHVVCHGIPSDRVLNEGDALNVDVTAIIDGYYGDTSRMFCIGKTRQLRLTILLMLLMSQ